MKGDIKSDVKARIRLNFLLSFFIFLPSLMLSALALGQQQAPVWPTDHKEVTNGYDPDRMHPATGEPRSHRAIDIRNPKGDPVYSILDGTVAEIYQGGDGGAGNYVKVYHRGGLQSSYTHTRSSLEIGEQVARGQVIGTSDGSGTGAGPHLNFSLRQNGNRIDPCSRLSCP